MMWQIQNRHPTCLSWRQSDCASPSGTPLSSVTARGICSQPGARARSVSVCYRAVTARMNWSAPAPSGFTPIQPTCLRTLSIWEFPDHRGQERLCCAVSQQFQRRSTFPFDLFHGALSRSFVGTPTKKFSPVAKASASEVIELNLDHELGIQRLPFSGSFCAPTTQTIRSFAGEARRLDYFFQALGQRRTLLVAD